MIVLECAIDLLGTVNAENMTAEISPPILATMEQAFATNLQLVTRARSVSSLRHARVLQVSVWSIARSECDPVRGKRVDSTLETAAQSR